MLNNSFWPSLFAFCSVFFATLVLIEFGIYVAGRYRERFLEEAGTELDDVLIQMPAGRVLDISLGLATAGVIATAILLSTQVESFSWKWGARVAFGVGAVLFMVPRIILRYLKKRRLRKFNIQLEEALGIISSSLKAGFSINQALDEVAGQNIHPVSVEFRLLTQEIRLGVPLEQALENMNSRLGSDDFELVATAVLTARQTGGELTGTLERVAALIRERVKIANKVRALTAVGRLQAIIIAAMPFFLLYMMTRVSPELMGEFLHSFAGVMAVILVVILDLLGFLWIRKITTIEV